MTCGSPELLPHRPIEACKFLRKALQRRPLLSPFLTFYTSKALFVKLRLYTPAKQISKDILSILAIIYNIVHRAANGHIDTILSAVAAKEAGLISIQRFFAYDSHGVGSISEVLANTKPDIMEIMPGIIGKVIQRFVTTGIPLIAGGLVETRQEVNTALTLGAFAVSTGREELWYE